MRCDFTPAGHVIARVEQKRIDKGRSAGFAVQIFVRVATKCLVNVSHCSYTSNDDQLDLLIKTGNTQNERMMSYPYHSYFQKV